MSDIKKIDAPAAISSEIENRLRELYNVFLEYTSFPAGEDLQSVSIKMDQRGISITESRGRRASEETAMGGNLRGEVVPVIQRKLF